MGIAYLEAGKFLNLHIPQSIESIIFTDITAPPDRCVIDLSLAKDMGIAAWQMDATFYISTQTPGSKIIASGDCSYMFYNKTLLKYIDLSMLDTSNVLDMSHMFGNCQSLASVRIGKCWDTGMVLDMTCMFWCCYKLVFDCSDWNISNVRRSFNFNFRAINVTEPMWSY